MDLPLSSRQPLHAAEGPAQAQADPAQDGQGQGGEQHRQGGQALDHPAAGLLAGLRQSAAAHIRRQQKVPLSLIEEVVGLAPPLPAPEQRLTLLGPLRLVQLEAGTQLRPRSPGQTGVIGRHSPCAVLVPAVYRHGGVPVELSPRLGQASAQPPGQAAVVQLHSLKGLGGDPPQDAAGLPLRGGLAGRENGPPHQDAGPQGGRSHRQGPPAHQHGQPHPPLLPQQEPQQHRQRQHAQGQPRQNQPALDRGAVEHPAEIGHRAPPVQQQPLAVHQQQGVPVPGHPQVGAAVQVIGLLLQIQEGVRPPVGKVRKADLQLGPVYIIDPVARLGQLRNPFPGLQGDRKPVRPDQLVSGSQGQGAVRQRQGGAQAGLMDRPPLLQTAGGAGPLVEAGAVPLDHRKGHHAVHLGKVGQIGARHLGRKLLPRTDLVQKQLRLPPLAGDAVDLEPGLLPGVVQSQVDRPSRRGVEQGRGAVLGHRAVLQGPALRAPAALVPDHQLIARLGAAQGVDLPLRVGGGEEVIPLPHPGGQDGAALRPQVPEQQNRASAQNGQKRQKNTYFFQSVHTFHLRLRRANHRFPCPQAREHQRRKKFFFSRAS